MVGPVRFVARVFSEVPTGEVLRVSLQDERLEAEESATPDTFAATIAPEKQSDEEMKFSVETGGPAAHNDEPTADYVSPPGGDPEASASDDLMVAFSLKNDEVTASGDLEIVEPVIIDQTPEAAAAQDVEIVDEVEIVEEVELIEKLDVIDAGDVEIVDEVEEVDIVDETEATDGDEMEDDLRDFLSGLD